MGDVVVIEAALNGARSRADHPAVPYTPVEVAEEARRCAGAGAIVFHIHARSGDATWSADPAWYADAHRRIRAAVPDALVSITSIRPAGVPTSTTVELLAVLASDPTTCPDLVSVNLGHTVAWEPTAPSAPTRRRTVHYPNG